MHWRRPELGICEYAGSKANNIILTPESLAEMGGDPAHTAAFLDANPACPPDQKYKIVVVGSKPRGLYILKSADGIHFSPLSYGAIHYRWGLRFPESGVLGSGPRHVSRLLADLHGRSDGSQ